MDISRHLIHESISIREAMELLNSAKKVLFVEQDMRLLGSVTDGDIRRWILSGGSLDEPISEAMHRKPITVPETDIENVRKLIALHDLLAIPVVDQENVIQDIFFWNDKQQHQKQIEMNVPVVIMAGGKGERLMPYTSILPKPLIPVGEKPIIEHVIESFTKYGIENFILSINYKKNMLKAYFDDLERDYKVSYVEEDKPLGTGGSLYFLKDKVMDTFFVSNCDILLDVDYESIYRFHKKNGNVITIVTSMKKYVLPYGVISLTDTGFVEGIQEKPATDYLVNTGVYVLEPRALEFICKDEFMHITQLIEACINAGLKIGAYPIREEAWMDMGQLEDLEHMKNKLNSEPI